MLHPHSMLPVAVYTVGATLKCTALHVSCLSLIDSDLTPWTCLAVCLFFTLLRVVKVLFLVLICHSIGICVFFPFCMLLAVWVCSLSDNEKLFLAGMRVELEENDLKKK